MEDRLLTVKEYAKEAGVTEQAVYKRLRSQNSELKAFVVEQHGKKYIKPEALEVLPTKQSADQSESETLREMVDLLKDQLKIKDEQINSLQKQNEQLTEALQSTTASLQAAQALHAGTIQHQLAESHESAQTDVQEPAEAQNGQEVHSEVKQKRGFFSRLFG